MNNPPEADPQVEQYVYTLYRCLFDMPLRQRQGIRDEIRQHVLEIVAHHEAEGVGHSQSVEMALAQFGDPKKIGKHIADKWRQENVGPSKFRRSIPEFFLRLTGACIIGFSWNFSTMAHPGIGVVISLALLGGSVLGFSENQRTRSDSCRAWFKGLYPKGNDTLTSFHRYVIDISLSLIGCGCFGALVCCNIHHVNQADSPENLMFRTYFACMICIMWVVSSVRYYFFLRSENRKVAKA